MSAQKLKKNYKKSQNLQIILEKKAIYTLAFTGMASAFLMLYLGFTIGRAYRLPDENTMSQVAVRSQDDQLKSTDKKDLTVFKLNQQPETINQYENELEKLLLDARQTPAAVITNKKQSEKKVPTPASSNKAEGNLLYTIQVTAISDYKRANELVKTLKSKNFDAYLQAVSGGNGDKIYRIRVGKVGKKDAEALFVRLGPITRGMNPAIIMIEQ